MGKQRFNYPKHPLFGIAPILYNWRGDPRHDEYTSHLVGRIRAGRYTSDLWDCNSLYLNYPERAPINAAPSTVAVKSRFTMSAEERKAWNNSYGDPAMQAERAAKKERAAAERAELDKILAARRAEQERLQAEYEERLRQKAAEQERRDREWREAEAKARAERAAEAARLRLAHNERVRQLAAAEVAKRQSAYHDRAAARLVQELAKLNPDQELIKVFKRWLQTS